MYASLISLVAFVLMASAVAHGNGSYGFEDPAFTWLGAPSSTADWANLAQLLPVPTLAAAFVVSASVALARRAVIRVFIYAALVAAALFTSEYVVKPLVQRSYYGELTFPSGSVTAVCAASIAVWLALFPLIGARARTIVMLIGVAWTLVMGVAVVGALWHTPVDVLGSILLSVGIVTGGAAVFEHVTAQRRPSS